LKIENLRAHLSKLAIAGKTATYGVLAQEFSVRIAELTKSLEAMMAEDAAAGRPLLAVVCEGRLNGGMPARGFFEAAEALGRDVSDPVGFVRSERAALVAAAGALPRTPR
jgi:hypothetical protein